MKEKETLTKGQSLIILAFYAWGWIFDWGYFIALAKELESNWLLATSIVLGWALALLWPLHAAVEFWSWILGG